MHRNNNKKIKAVQAISAYDKNRSVTSIIKRPAFIETVNIVPRRPRILFRKEVNCIKITHGISYPLRWFTYRQPVQQQTKESN